MSYNKLNENQPPSYQATENPQGQPPKYESGYPPQGEYPPQRTTVILSQPVIIGETFGPYSKVIKCPNCGASVSTSTDHEPGLLTWLSSGICCLFGLWLGCCLIPFCVNDLQDVKHNCPNCGQYLGIYRRMG